MFYSALCTRGYFCILQEMIYQWKQSLGQDSECDSLHLSPAVCLATKLEVLDTGAV